MNIDKDEVTIGAIVVGWLVAIFTGGRAYEKMGAEVRGVSSRVEILEDRPPCISDIQCLERRDACNRENRLRFEAGAKEFAEIKTLIADNDKCRTAQHKDLMAQQREMMKLLMEMNK